MTKMRRTSKHARRLAGRGVAMMVTLGAGLAAGPAAALMPPFVYETARNTAASVIIVTVEKVTPPRRPFGNCTVDGTVAQVERGTAYQPGQKVSLEVPCQTADASPPIGGTIYLSLEALSASKYGRAYLDEKGKVTLSQYEMLKALP